MSQKLFTIISEVMSVPLSELTDDSGPENIDSWDSFNGLLLVDELESKFNITFSLEEVVDVKSISDIKRHLVNHGVSFE
ncbi:acyl carrier protein [Nitrosopumilus sp.]|nr:acyl carrier protein [Nitrosopumilus sp.]MDC0639043.1 acyl carrier protein [Nitrosopumilus sp.]